MTAAEPPVDPDVELAVVGGGPVGVTCALLAAKQGLSVRVFEQAEDIYDLPRAVGMDAEIQRVFQNVGLSERLGELTTPVDGAEFTDAAGNRIIGNDIPSDGPFHLGHHPQVMYHQPWLEAMLREEATAAGAELRLGVTVSSVDVDGGGATVTTDEGITSARWVVAADGAASPVRKSLGIAFVDQGFDQDWLVFDVAMHEGVDGLDRLAKQVCRPDRPVTIVPGHRNFRRWEFQLQPGESAEEMTDPARVWELISEWVTPDQGELSRAVVYRFHATVAESMRRGPVFLAGDAAHQMPPFLGQGLCSGIRDAANLTWKLGMVARGTAAEDILDTYDEERRPHAVDMVAHAVDTGRLIDKLAGRVASGVGLESGYGGGREFPYLQHGLVVGDHARTGKRLGQPTVDGELFDGRLGPGFAVVCRDRDAVPDDIERVWAGFEGRIVEAPPGTFENDLPPGGAIIVRPDRYIAAVADGPESLADATARLASMLRPA